MSNLNEFFKIKGIETLNTNSFNDALARFDSELKSINSNIVKTSDDLEKEIAKKLEKIKPIVDVLLSNNLSFQHIKVKSHSSKHGIVLAVTKCKKYSIVFDGTSLKKVLLSSDTIEDSNIKVTSLRDDRLISDVLEQLNNIYKNLMSDILENELKYQSKLCKVLETV